MNQNILPQNFDNGICEVIDCNAKAVKTVEVNAGIYGQIILFLCTECIDKFKEVKVK